MIPPFQKADFDFKYFPIDPPSAIPKAQINGWAVLCTWPEEGYIGHSSFSFDESASESLYAAKYHHQLIDRIDKEIVQRSERRAVPSGGALLKIEQGNCSGSMIPDTNVGGNIATINEVSDD